MKAVQKLFRVVTSGGTFAGNLPMFPVSSPGGKPFYLRDVNLSYKSNQWNQSPTSLFVILGRTDRVVKDLLNGSAFTFRTTVAGPPLTAFGSFVPSVDDFDGSYFANNYADGSVATPSTIPANIIRLQPCARILLGNWYDGGPGGWHHERFPDIYIRTQGAGEDCVLLVPGMFHNIKDNTTFSDSPDCSFSGLFSCKVDYNV